MVTKNSGYEVSLEKKSKKKQRVSISWKLPRLKETDL